MKTYGQDATDLFEWARDLEVDSDFPDLVYLSTYPGHVAHLTYRDVKGLVYQLEWWLHKEEKRREE